LDRWTSILVLRKLLGRPLKVKVKVEVEVNLNAKKKRKMQRVLVYKDMLYNTEYTTNNNTDQEKQWVSHSRYAQNARHLSLARIVPKPHIKIPSSSKHLADIPYTPPLP
jgi:hypothetical protein